MKRKTMGISMKDFPLCSLDCQKILLPRKSKQKMYRMQKEQMELSKQTKKGKKQNLWKESPPSFCRKRPRWKALPPAEGKRYLPAWEPPRTRQRKAMSAPLQLPQQRVCIFSI